MRTIWDVIKAPVITEKALVAKEESQDGRQLLTFRVDVKATKPEIKSAVERIFGGRFEGRKPSWKKAYVTLKTGQAPFDYGENI
jgi:large subunit ribosomal protein L23